MIVQFEASNGATPSPKILTPRMTVLPPNVPLKQISTDVPEPFRQDFLEASLVLPISAKASAALSRRTMQAILRERAGTKKKDLFGQIEEVLDSGQLPSYISDDLHAVRNIGNFAAHEMRNKEEGTIVGVEQGEAEWTLNVLDAMIDFFFIEPAKAAKRRQEYNNKLRAAGKSELPDTSTSTEKTPALAAEWKQRDPPVPNRSRTVHDASPRGESAKIAKKISEMPHIRCNFEHHFLNYSIESST